MSLNSPAIAEGCVVVNAENLLDEWLGDYFDGAIHTIGMTQSGVVFPSCAIMFGQGEIQQPVDQTDKNPSTPATEIRVITTPPRPERPDTIAGGFNVTAYTVFRFEVRTKQQPKGKSRYMARQVGELLCAILNNPENVEPLNEKGIKHLAPKFPVEIPSKDYHEYQVTCMGQLEWPISFKSFN